MQESDLANLIELDDFLIYECMYAVRTHALNDEKESYMQKMGNYLAKGYLAIK